MGFYAKFQATMQLLKNCNKRGGIVPNLPYMLCVTVQKCQTFKKDGTTLESLA